MTDQTVVETMPQNETQEPGARQLFVRMVLVAFVMFWIGFLLTTAISEWIGFKNFPTEGSISVQRDGQQVFAPAHPTFRHFAVIGANHPLGKEPTRFDPVGIFGRGLFFYSIANAPHWNMELRFTNTKAIAFVPFLVLLAGCLFLFQLLPRSMWTGETILRYAISISVLHALFCVLMLTATYLFYPAFRVLFAYPLYVGELLGVLFPGLVVILTTSILIGAMIGWVAVPLVYVVDEIKKVIFVPKKAS